MKKDKSYNEELPIENLFRDAFEHHKEATEEKDFDQFLNQLEETGYFNKSKKRPFFLLWIALSIMGVVALYFLVNTLTNKTKDKQTATVTNNSRYSEQEFNKASSNLKKDSIEIFSDNNEISIIKKNEPKTVSGNQAPPKDVLPSTSIQTGDIIPLNENKPFKEDTIQKQNTDVKKPVFKDSVRIKYIMKVDTIKHIDSLNINKKKWSKIKGKK